MKIVIAIFEKMKIFIFFLCELPLILSLSSFAWFLCKLSLILRVGRKLKTRSGDICKETLDIEFEQDRSIGLGSTIGNGQTDRQTDTDTHTHF